MWNILIITTVSAKVSDLTNYLSEIGCEVYRPTYTKIFPHRRYKGIKLFKSFDLFPGYLFIKTEDKNWPDIKWQSGVFRLLMSGERIAEISNECVEELDIVCKDLSNKARAHTMSNSFRVGQKVKISEGPFESTFGTIINKNGESKLIIDLDGVSMISSIELTADKVVSAAA